MDNDRTMLELPKEVAFTVIWTWVPARAVLGAVTRTWKDLVSPGLRATGFEVGSTVQPEGSLTMSMIALSAVLPMFVTERL